LGESDQHILNTIADNLEITCLCVGLFEDETSPQGAAIVSAAQALARRRKESRKKVKNYADLEINFFDSKTAPVWTTIQ